jgi:hypothetical protein
MPGSRKSENIIMKNIIARRIPTFRIRERGVDVRLFSNFINAKSRKKIEAAIRMSSKILKKNSSEFPKIILKINNRKAASKKSCN